MKIGLRLGIALVAVAMLTAPLAFSQSTRDVHETYYDTFIPEDADISAQERDASVNCGAGTDMDAHAEAHYGTPDLAGGDSENYNSGLDCWDSTDHSLWADQDGIVAASAPFYTCQSGYDVDVSLQNPFPVHMPDGVDEASAADNGVIVASGSFYVIPEISGDDADQVEAVWFSFLETAPTVNEAGTGGGSDDLCASTERHAASAGGAYYEFYRGDKDKSDEGWIIPVNTLLVPDNVYGAKLTFLGHAEETEGVVDEGTIPAPYPGGLDVIGMGYVYAIVDNDEDDTTWSPCEPTRQPCDNQDTTPPWPQIIPGDVPLDEVSDQDTVTVTFGEHIQVESLDVILNPGTDDQDLPHGLSDSDTDIPHHSSSTDSAPLIEVSTDEWGEQLSWNVQEEFGFTLDDCTVIQVNALDLHGNEATKTVTAGDC